MDSTLYSVFVYFLTLLLMLFFNAMSIRNAQERLNAKPKVNIPLLSILIFAIVFGIRYDVGIDHLRYIEQYDSIRIFDADVDAEIGFVTVERFFSFFNAHYALFFTFIAFLQLFLICYSLRNNYEVIGWMFITFMFSTIFLNFMNGIRQEVAFCFQTVAIYFLSQRKLLLCYLMLLLAILFHSSAILLLPLPLLFIWKSSYFNKISLQLILFFLSIVISFLFKPAVAIFTLLLDFMEILGYGGYKYMFLGGDMSYLEAKREPGLGFLLLIMMNLINIIQSRNVKSYFNSNFLNIVYDFYFVGIVYNYLISGSLILGRVNYYFYNFSFIISAFTLHYLFSCKGRLNKLLFFALLAIYILVFCAVVILRGPENRAIYNTFL